MADRTACGSRTTSRPKTRTAPASGLMRVATHRTNVVLPAPLGPRMARITPCSARSSSSSSATVVPNRLTTPVASIIGVMPFSPLRSPCDIAFLYGPISKRQRCSSRILAVPRLALATRHFKTSQTPFERAQRARCGRFRRGRRCDTFPQIPVGIAEVPEVPAPFGGSSRLDDLSSSARRPAQNLIDFLGGRDDVAQREPAKPGALGGHASVLGEPLPRVERESLDEPSPRSRATKLPSSHWIVHPRST